MGTSQGVVERLAEWRGAVARAYLTGIVAVMPVVLVTWTALRPPPIINAPFLFIAGSWFAFVAARWLAPERFQAAAVVVLLALAGLTGPLVLGFSPGPFLSSVSAVVLASLAFGRRAGLAVYAVTALAVGVQGALISGGVVTSLRLESTDPFVAANWVRLALFNALTTGILVWVLTGLLERMEAAWTATEAAAAREREEQRQRRLIEERAIEAQRLEAIGRLAGGVAHDFNNLLVVMMSWADLLPNAKDEAERKEGLDAIREATTQAAQLTRQLLSFARKGESSPTAVDVDAFVDTTLRSLRRLLPADVALVHLRSGAPPALADAAQLGQVLLNLAVNAGDAMPRGGTLTIRTALVEPPAVPPEAPERSRRYVAILVSDTGIGMDEPTRLRIFEPFFTTKGTGRGTGLGLATVYGVATQAGGWVSVESQPAKGTTFLVAFPVAEPAVTAAKEPSASPPALAGRRCRVLLVDDDPAVRAAMANALTRAGVELTQAANGDEALAIARRHREDFDVLCTDGVMPGLPTHQLVEGFRQLFPRAHVLLCSGYVQDELLQRGLAEGSVHELPKPFTPEQLVARVLALGAKPPA